MIHSNLPALQNNTGFEKSMEHFYFQKESGLFNKQEWDQNTDLRQEHLCTFGSSEPDLDLTGVTYPVS